MASSPSLSPADAELLRASFRVAEQARDAGNQPFGAVLADADGRLRLEAGNSVVADQDPTAHAERNLVTLARRSGWTEDDLAAATLYASTEPCPMCAGAIYWGGIGRVVFGLSQARFYALIHSESGGDEAFVLSCAEVFARGTRNVDVLGPVLEDEALAVHEGFWGKD